MEPFIGQLMLVGFNFAPRGWALCEGQLLSLSDHTALYSLLGTTYGGDGRTSFGLPDLRGRIPVGQGNGPGIPVQSWGEKSGTATNTLSVGQLPANIPAEIKVSTANVDLSVANDLTSIARPGFMDGRAFNATLGFNQATPDTALSSGSINVGGSGQAVNNMQPSLGMYWIIALQGNYPSRN